MLVSCWFISFLVYFFSTVVCSLVFFFYFSHGFISYFQVKCLNVPLVILVVFCTVLINNLKHDKEKYLRQWNYKIFHSSKIFFFLMNRMYIVYCRHVICTVTETVCFFFSLFKIAIIHGLLYYRKTCSISLTSKICLTFLFLIALLGPSTQLSS